MIDPVIPGPPFCPSASYPLLDDGIAEEPEGIAIDSLGNAWVAKTGAGKVALLEASTGFTPAKFDGDGSIVGPWGVAVDGADNIWVADFFGKRLIQLCGASGNCPPGLQPGDPISPSGEGGGYGGNGALQSITSVNIDQAGNVWVANNFDENDVCLLGQGIPPEGEPSTVRLERLQTRCGGNGAVVFFGVAAPVRAPLIGPPQQP